MPSRRVERKLRLFQILLFLGLANIQITIRTDLHVFLNSLLIVEACKPFFFRTRFSSHNKIEEYFVVWHNVRRMGTKKNWCSNPYRLSHKRKQVDKLSNI